MTTHEGESRALWLSRLHGWHARLDEAGLGGLAAGLAAGLKPLGPLTAQLLWFSQPGFALFGQSGSIGALAELLEDLPDDDHTTGFRP